jgi:hypothetical protein
MSYLTLAVLTAQNVGLKALTIPKGWGGGLNTIYMRETRQE